MPFLKIICCFIIIKENKLLSRHLLCLFPALTAMAPKKSMHQFSLNTCSVPSAVLSLW